MRYYSYEIREVPSSRDLEIVHWTYTPDNPWMEYDNATGQYSYRFEYCTTIGYLRWESKDGGYFRFVSVGMRWLETAPSEEICQHICRVAADYEERYHRRDM